MSKPVVMPIFTATAALIWNLTDKVLIREEEPRIYVLQFKTREEKDRILGGGPWFFSGSMMVLADYDVLRQVEDFPLNTLEVWVSVLGLWMTMRNEKVFTRLGNDLGTFVRVDPMAGQLQRSPSECGFSWMSVTKIRLVASSISRQKYL